MNTPLHLKQGLSNRTAAQRRAELAHKVRSGSWILAPGVFEMISAKMADSMGFDALYMTGYGTVASYLGLPDAGLASVTDMLNRVTQLASITQTPLICDGDTGYGGLLNVMHTVRGYERAGACAIQLEDQEFPKKCGHMLGRKVTPAQDMVAKIKVAVETREDPNFLIIARTDARTTLGLDEALLRAESYAKAGADILFVESPESEEEMRKICTSFDVPCLANMVEGGRTPVLSRAALQDIGYKVAIFPVTSMLAAAQAFAQVYGQFSDQGSSQGLTVPLHDFQKFSQLMGFDWVAQFDRDHA
jgi:2-methylisocitrate lyase-like PEP mutase family enzyme